MPVLMLTAADRLDDKASGFGLGADDYLASPSNSELVLRLSSRSTRRSTRSRPPVREILRYVGSVPPQVYRSGRYIALTRKQFRGAPEVLVAAKGATSFSAELPLERSVG